MSAMTTRYCVMDDANRYWPRKGLTMLAYSPADAQMWESRAEAESKVTEIHKRAPKGPFPWRVHELPESAVVAWQPTQPCYMMG